MNSRPTKIDGRRLRSERTKQLIIEAYLALAQEMSPRVPTAAEIAERAGYSVRSVFERFPDLRALQVAAVDYSLAQMSALAPPWGADGDRRTRIESHVPDTRSDLRELAAAVAVADREPGRLAGTEGPHPSGP